MNIKNLSSAVVVGALMSQSLFAASLLKKSSEFKGYPKRDRLTLTTTQAISPAQLHEVYGVRFDGGINYNTTNIKDISTNKTIKADESAPTFAVSGIVGGDLLVLGLGASTTTGTGSIRGIGDVETYTANKLIPQIALTIKNHFTIGLSSDLINMKLEETERNLDYNFTRETVGLSYHTSKMEMGIAYSTKGTAEDTAKTTDNNQSFSLIATSNPAETTRSIYMADHVTAFVRGNTTNSLSLMGSVTHAQYSAKEDGSSQLFSKYKKDDRLAGMLQATYWMPNQSRINTSLVYQGAAVAPTGSLTPALGNRIANLYGAAFDFVAKINTKTSLGLNINYLRGQRYESVSDVAVKTKEENYGVGASISHNI